MRVGPTEGDDAAAGRAVSVKKNYIYINIYLSRWWISCLQPQRPLSVGEGRAWSASLSVKVVPGTRQLSILSISARAEARAPSGAASHPSRAEPS